MRRLFCINRFLLMVSLGFTVMSREAMAQYRTYVVHDTQPVITHGPHLIAPTEDGVSIVWTTDIPSQARVFYGMGNDLSLVAESVEDGLVSVDTVHTVRLMGLKPGQTYSYRVVSTGVTDLKAYWPEKTRSVESATYSFEVPDRSKSSVTFSFITDTQHEDLTRLKANLDLIEWDRLDFLVHGGDAVDRAQDQAQLFDHFLDPVGERLAHQKPLVFARGNHEMRGPFARSVRRYFPNGTGHFYYAFDAGPVHFIVLDTGEDKSDTTSVYSDLNRVKSYREQELAWFREHVASDPRVKSAPFRILLLHAPAWGWIDGEHRKWTQVANEAGIDLVIGGHNHRYARVAAGAEGNTYPLLIVDQDQVARVKATRDRIHVTVVGKNGATADEFELPLRASR